MKLLMAFIEASGYEIEEVFEQKITSGQILVPHDYKVTKKRKKLELIDMYLFTYCEINKDKFIGAGMYIFEIETTNPKDSYIDGDNNIPHPNPVIADCEGRFPNIYIEKPYKVVIHNRHGVQIFEDFYK